MSNSPSLLFRLAGLMATLFVLTVFVMIAGVFSDPNLPMNTWLNHNGIPLLLGEVGLVLVLGVLAMATDRVPVSNRGSEPATSEPESSPLTPNP